MNLITICRWVGWFVGRFIVVWLVGWLVSSATGWLVGWSVCWLDGLSVALSACQSVIILLKESEVTLPCSFQRTCLICCSNWFFIPSIRVSCCFPTGVGCQKGRGKLFWSWTNLLAQNVHVAMVSFCLYEWLLFRFMIYHLYVLFFFFTCCFWGILVIIK